MKARWFRAASHARSCAWAPARSQVMLWRYPTFTRCLQFDSDHLANVLQAKFLHQRNDTALVTSGADGQVRLALVGSGGAVARGTRRLTTHEGRVHKISIKPNSADEILTSGEDGVIKHVDLRAKRG